MKEEDYKKIIEKSGISTSDGFVDEVMQAISNKEAANSKMGFWKFKPILIILSILILVLTLLLFKLLNLEAGSLNTIIKNQNTLVFIGVTFALLYHLNSVIKLNNSGPI